MRCNSGLTTAEILAVFEEEVTARGGRVTETIDDGRWLFTRSVLSRSEPVRPGDRVQGGVALKATETEVCVYPYLFRLVCRNGAIMAQTIGSLSLADIHLEEPETARQSIREAIAACSTEEVFCENVRSMRAACRSDVDQALNLLPILARFSGPGGTGLLSQIMSQFFREEDRSRFGLVNAITATARDTRDPDLRWDLEELGGAVLMGDVPKLPVAGGQVAMVS